ncbi:MAG: response regulator [Nannocystales bacterium]
MPRHTDRTPPLRGGRVGNKVLIVDDSLCARILATRALRPEFEVLEAIDGPDALKKLTSEISCVLCDLSMPCMNGLEFLAAARVSRTTLPPVLMLTAYGEHVARDPRARDLGVHGWIQKPVDPKSLLSTVQGLVYGAHESGRSAPTHLSSSQWLE